jgi:uncharacterized membrane protein YfcA
VGLYTAEDVVIVLAVALIAALVQGYSGFGFGIVASSLLAFTDLPMVQVAATITAATGAITLYLLWLSHAEARAHWRLGLLVLAGVVVGQPIGYGFIHIWGDAPVFRVVLGLVLMGFGLAGVATRNGHRHLPPLVGVGAGALGGFLSGAFVTGGPPIVAYLYAQEADPRQMKATVQFVFLTSVGCRLLWITAAGDWGPGTLWLALGSLPVVLPAVGLGHYLSRRGSSTAFRRTVYLLIGLIGGGVLAKGAWAWMR